MEKDQIKSSKQPIDFSPINPIAKDFEADGHIRIAFKGLNGKSDLPRPHLHNILEVGIIHEGRATFQIDDKWLDFKAGDISIITPSEQHRAFYPVNSICSWMFFDIPQLLAHSAKETSLTDIQSFAGPGFINIFTKKDYPILVKIAQDMANELEHKNLYYKDTIRSLLVMLLTQLHRLVILGDYHFSTIKDTSKKAFGNIERISPALDYMHKHYSTEIDISLLAKKIGMSASNFRRIFNTCLGCSPHAYLSDYRIAAAIALLNKKTMTVEAVAQECGISDPSSFRRAFKKRTGKSPHSVRAGFGNSHCKNYP